MQWHCNADCPSSSSLVLHVYRQARSDAEEQNFDDIVKWLDIAVDWGALEIAVAGRLHKVAVWFVICCC